MEGDRKNKKRKMTLKRRPNQNEDKDGLVCGVFTILRLDPRITSLLILLRVLCHIYFIRNYFILFLNVRSPLVSLIILISELSAAITF